MKFGYGKVSSSNHTFVLFVGMVPYYMKVDFVSADVQEILSHTKESLFKSVKGVQFKKLEFWIR